MIQKRFARSKTFSCFMTLVFLINACGISQSISSLRQEMKIVPYDDDNDEVTLAFDRCPDTRPEDLGNLDSHGCVIDDDDHDKVNIPFDLCPNTPPGEKVWTSNGCMDHYYRASVDLIADDGTVVKEILAFGYEMSKADTIKIVVSLVPDWLAGYSRAHAGEPKIETFSKDDSPEPKCLNDICNSQRPKSADDFGDRLGMDFGNKNNTAGTDSSSPTTGSTGNGTGSSGTDPIGTGSGGTGGTETTGTADSGASPGGSDSRPSPDSEEGWSESGDPGTIGDLPGTVPAEDGQPTDPVSQPLPKAPQPSLPVTEKGTTSTGGGTGTSPTSEEVTQILANAGLKSQADSPYASRLYKVAKNLQDLEGKTTERLQSPQATTMFNNMIQIARSSLGRADDYYSTNNESQGNSFLYVAAMMAEAAYDLATSDLGKEILTSVGPAAEIRDLYEAATGRSIFDNHELTNWERGMAVFGAATGGVGSKVFKGLKVADKILGVGMLVKKIGKPLGQAENVAEIAVREARAIKDLSKEKYDLARKIQGATGVDLKTSWNGVKAGINKEDEVFAHRDLLTRMEDDFKVEKLVDASEVNKIAESKGLAPPYLNGTKTIEFVTEANEIFVRVHGEANKARAWMMKPSDIQGLNAAEIQAKFNIKDLPQYISEVHVPSGTPIRTGIVGPTGTIGNSQGAIQYELLKNIDKDLFTNTVPLF